MMGSQVRTFYGCGTSICSKIALSESHSRLFMHYSIMIILILLNILLTGIRLQEIRGPDQNCPWATFGPQATI